MQIKSLHKNVYKLYAWSRTQECLDAYRSLHQERVSKWQILKKEGVSDAKCAELSGFSRASYYRSKQHLARLAEGYLPPSKKPKKTNKKQWGEAEKQLVLQVRRANPTYGKDKISVIIKRDHGRQISASTTGRILKHLFDKRLISKSISAPRMRRKRHFRKAHAKAWTYKKYDKMQIGERVQIDHMTVTKNGLVCKHFQAWDRKSKFIYAEIYSHAKATSAERFLYALIDKIPFPIISIQVDGGSEFMAEFEQACQKHDIELIVLPPARPKYNGGVERGNRIFREEFYERNDLIADSIGAMRFELKNALDKYNTYRPHKALDGKTPYEYIQSNQSQRSNLSHSG